MSHISSSFGLCRMWTCSYVTARLYCPALVSWYSAPTVKPCTCVEQGGVSMLRLEWLRNAQCNHPAQGTYETRRERAAVVGGRIPSGPDEAGLGQGGGHDGWVPVVVRRPDQRHLG